MSSDPFRILGIAAESSEQEIRIAWRQKLRASHPDAGGTHEESILINRALVDALATVHSKNVPTRGRSEVSLTHRSVREVSSFTIDVLPVECWQAMEIVAGHCGTLIVDEPPYVIEFTMHDSGLEHSAGLWCRCEMVPEAGATTVHITLGAIDHLQAPSLEVVRDYLVDLLNELDWQV